MLINFAAKAFAGVIYSDLKRALQEQKN